MRRMSTCSRLVSPKTNEEAIEDEAGRQAEKLLASNDAEEATEEAIVDGDGRGDDNIEPEDVDVEVRQAQGGTLPYRPSAKDVAEHNLTHLKYRNWCPICLKACGVSDPHYAGVDRSDRNVPAVSADYCFMCRDPELEESLENTEDDEEEPEQDEANILREKATILDVKDTLTGCIRARWVSRRAPPMLRG